MNILDSIKLILANRSKSPFYGSLFITWVAYNWRLLFILLFDNSFETIQDKIEFIGDNYITTFSYNGYVVGWSNLYIPLVFTVLVFVLGSIFSILFRRINIEFKNWQKKIDEGHEIYTKKETKKIKKELDDYKDRISLQSSDLRSQNESLQKQVDESNKEIDRLNQLFIQAKTPESDDSEIVVNKEEEFNPDEFIKEEEFEIDKYSNGGPTIKRERKELEDKIKREIIEGLEKEFNLSYGQSKWVVSAYSAKNLTVSYASLRRMATDWNDSGFKSELSSIEDILFEDMSGGKKIISLKNKDVILFIDKIVDKDDRDKRLLLIK